MTTFPDIARTSNPGVQCWRICLLIVILIGGGARLVDPPRMLFWHDEIYTNLRVFGHTQPDIDRVLFSGVPTSPANLLSFQRPAADKSWGDTLAALTRHPEQGPLYYLLARAAGSLATPAESGPRWLSAMIGLLLAPAVFWFVRELWGIGRAPWIAATLISVSPLHLLYAQEARPYALWTVLLVAAGAALIRALRRERTAAWLLYGLLFTLGLYTHLLFLLLVPVHGLYAMLTRRRWPPAAWFWALALACVLFLPWIAILWLNAEMVGHFLAWMERPLTLSDIFTAWGRHLTHLFVDPAPSPFIALLGLLPLTMALVLFCRKAPSPGRWLICLIGVTWVGVVLGPDLLTGGSRSGHARYALPALLAVQLAVAWVLASLWEDGKAKTAGTLVAVLIALGFASQWRILQADTWWTKNFSESNKAVARLVNAAPHPLILVSNQGVSQGELFSLAHELRPDITIWGEPGAGDMTPPEGFDTIVVLTPSSRLRAHLAARYTLAPLLDTWQWFQAHPLTQDAH